MGLLKGILLGIPVGLYFGEKNLNFPLVIHRDSTSAESKIHMSLDYTFIGALAQDIGNLFGGQKSIK